jgi:phospholipase D1/2
VTRPILVAGETCATVLPSSRGGVLVDGHDFYRAFYEAACAAQHSILMTGWQFSTKVELLRGDEASDCPLPTQLLDFLSELCKQRPELQVYMLPWDSSPIFAFEREPLQQLRFHVRGHRRIHWKMDNCHPPGASHHQKLIVVDRAIAFIGGMDICDSRWDQRSHPAEPVNRPGKYAPYHDVQAYVSGDAVDVLRAWFAERWRLASGAPLDLPPCPRTSVTIRPSFEVAAPAVALARTWPEMDDPPHSRIRELFHLHARAIGAAKHLIYIENQYFTSGELAAALERRMRSDTTNALDIVMVLPARSAGFKERISIGVHQAQLLDHLGKVAGETGHRLGVYYPVARRASEGVPRDAAEIPVFIHAKVLAVDDRFLLVSSANTTNRSMGYDTELGIAWEAPEPTTSLHAARMELIAEHLGMSPAEAEPLVGSLGDIVPTLDELATAKTTQLRMHGRNRDEQAGRLLRMLIPELNTVDPLSEDHLVEGLLPEQGTLLDRLLRDPLSLFGLNVKKLRKRIAS